MFLPADLIFTRNEKSWIGPAIRWFTRSRGEAPTWTNHTAGVGLKGDTVIEAMWTVNEVGWKQWDAENDRYQVWRHTRLTDIERRIIAVEARLYVGRQYGWWKLFPHLLDGMLSKVIGGNVYLTRRLLFLPDYPICSWVWAYAYGKIGFRFGCSPDCADPDTQLDFIQNNHHWKKVFEKGE